MDEPITSAAAQKWLRDFERTKLPKFEAVLSHVLQGKSVVQACREQNTPSQSAFYNWIKDPMLNEQFDLRKRFTEVDQIRWTIEADRIIEIVERRDQIGAGKKKGETTGMDSAEEIARDKLRVEKIQWFLARKQPKIYADYTQRAAAEESGENDRKPTKIVERYPDPVVSGVEGTGAPDVGE